MSTPPRTDSGAATDPSGLPSRPVRLLTSVFVVLYVLASAATVLPDHAGGAVLQRMASPGIRAFALSQRWPMFAPNPPRADHRLVEEVRTPAGDWVVVPGPFVQPQAAVRLRHWRGSKAEELLWAENGKRRRRLRARALCQQQAAAGAPAVAVRFSRVSQRTLWPQDRLNGEIRPGPRQTDLGTVRCP